MSKEFSKKKSASRVTPDPVRSEETQGERSKRQAPVEPADKLKYEDLGSLPTGYGEVFLIARDPHWLFTYWDFDYSKFPTPRKLFLEVYRNDELESTVEINEIARNWYIPVQAAASEYSVVFGYRDAQDVWTSVGKAGPTQTPPESISPKIDLARSIQLGSRATRSNRLAEQEKFNASARSERPYEKKENSNRTRRVFCTRQTFLLLPRPASGAGHGDDCRYKITPALRRQVVCRSVSQAL